MLPLWWRRARQARTKPDPRANPAHVKTLGTLTEVTFSLTPPNKRSYILSIIRFTIQWNVKQQELNEILTQWSTLCDQQIGRRRFLLLRGPFSEDRSTCVFEDTESKKMTEFTVQRVQQPSYYDQTKYSLILLTQFLQMSPNVWPQPGCMDTCIFVRSSRYSNVMFLPKTELQPYWVINNNALFNLC